MLLAFAAAIFLSVASFRAPHQFEPQVTCGITTVSYRFVGTPGQRFSYDGETFRIPARGSIELIASKGVTTYRFSTRDLMLDVWPLDQFGTRTVPLPDNPERRPQ